MGSYVSPSPVGWTHGVRNGFVSVFIRVHPWLNCVFLGLLTHLARQNENCLATEFLTVRKMYWDQSELVGRWTRRTLQSPPNCPPCAADQDGWVADAHLACSRGMRSGTAKLKGRNPAELRWWQSRARGLRKARRHCQPLATRENHADFLRRKNVPLPKSSRIE